MFRHHPGLEVHAKITGNHGKGQFAWDLEVTEAKTQNFQTHGLQTHPTSAPMIF